MAKSQKEKAEEFAALHRSGIFVLANAWDFPSAAIAVEEGFKGIATTSAGMAFTLGLPDHEFTGRDRMTAIGVNGSYQLGPGVLAELGFFHGKITGNDWNNGSVR